MDIQAAGQVGALKGALETQGLAAKLITSTVDRLNSGHVGMTPAINADYLTQKSILTAAYGERGIGTNLDMKV